MSAVSGSTAVDGALLVLAALFALDGVRRGLVAGALGLAGVLVALNAALAVYPRVSPLLEQTLGAAPNVAAAVAFGATLAVAQVIATVVVNALLAALRPTARLARRPAAFRAERLAGALPGAGLAAVIATLALAPLRALPIPDAVAQAIDGSALAARVSHRTAPLVPGLERLVERAAQGPGTSYIVEPSESVTVPRVQVTQPDVASEDRMLELVNDERRRAGLRVLVMDEGFRGTARQQSQEMFWLGYFSHVSPARGDLETRLRGYVLYFDVAENLAYAPTVEQAHRGLMLSPHHRANILDARFTKVGIGVYSGGASGRMFTQHFAR